MQRPKFELKASYRLLGLWLSLYGGAMIIIISLALPWFLKLLGVLILSWQGWRVIGLHALRIAHKAIVQVWLDEAGQWHLKTRAGQQYQGRLLADSLITPALTLLKFKVPHRYLPIVLTICADAIDSHEFRRLRVYLKIA